MAMPSALGINATQPFGSYWTRYPSDVTNNSYFVAKVINNFSRMRCITKTNELIETEASPGGTQGAAPAHRSWCLSVKAVNPDYPILYGIDPGGEVKYYPPHHAFYRARMLIEAAWAEANGMDGFQVGNEHEVPHYSGSHLITASSMVRASNVVTVTFATAHGLTSGQEITVSGANEASFNVADSVDNPTTVVVTVTDTTHLTYPSVGTDGSATGTLKLGWSYHQERLMIKADAVAVQAVFSGFVTYSCSQGFHTGWIIDGITPGVDLDKIGVDVYGDHTDNNWTTFKSTVDACFAEFGTDLIITEMNASDPSDWNNTLIEGLAPTSKSFYKKWEQELIKRVNYCVALALEWVVVYTLWDIQNNWSLFYNNGTHNGQPTGTLDLEATFTGDILPVVKKLSGRRIDTVFMGSKEAQ